MPDAASAVVSVVIPVYKTAGYLPRCLDSVLAQTLREIEIVAIDDSSPDHAAEILKAYAAKDSRIRIVTHTENRGSPAGTGHRWRS